MFTPSEISVPEPLQRFDSLAAALAPVLLSIDELVTKYAVKHRSGGILMNVLDAIRIELTYHSNAIEGSTLTLRETQLIIEGKSPGSEKPLREIYEARNHDRALHVIEDWASSRNSNTPLTVHDILAVHAQVLADIDLQAAGHFRSERVLIAGTGYVPPGAHRFDLLIPAIVDFANRPNVHPVLQAAELHYNLVAVHPFSDGNGRTARLLMNYHLLKAGYPYAVIEVGKRGAYLNALDEANRGHIEPFARFISESVEQSIRKVIGD